MDTLISNPAYMWLVAGALVIAFEAFTVPGLGLFLAGLGSLCTGILVEVGIVSAMATAAQFAWFFGLTAVWTALLWQPLKKFRIRQMGKEGKGFSNMIGEPATVAKGGLKRGVVGQVTWSGTLMSAELDSASAVDSLPSGSIVEIKSVSGTTLKVTPK